MSMIEHTEIKTYSEKDMEEVITNRHTGTWHMRNCGGYSGYENIRLNFYDGHKPYWLHRLITRLLLGWEWEDKHE